MKVIIIPPGCEPAIVSADGFSDLRGLVGGSVESSELSDHLCVYSNEEGLLVGLPPNLYTQTGVLLVGVLVVVRVDRETGEEVDVRPEDRAFVKAWLDGCRRVGFVEYDVPAPTVFTGGSVDQFLAVAHAHGRERVRIRGMRT